MHKKILAGLMAAVMACMMAGCTVLPVEESQTPVDSEVTASSETQEENENGIIVKEKTEEEIRAAYIENYKMRYVVGMLMHLPPIPTNAELERMEMEEKQQTPYATAEKELINYCRNQSDLAIKDFLSDYPTDDYFAGEESRTLKKSMTARPAEKSMVVQRLLPLDMKRGIGGLPTANTTTWPSTATTKTKTLFGCCICAICIIMLWRPRKTWQPKAMILN